MDDAPRDRGYRARPKRVLLVCGLLALALVTTAAAMIGWGRWRYRGQQQASDTSASRWARPQPRPSDYVGSDTCRECHSEISQQYAAHPMARSLAHASQSMVEDYDPQRATFQPSPRHRYYVEHTDDGIFHHEVALDPSGEPIYDQGVPIAYAVGSGRRGRSYILNRDGFLYMSAISWYASNQRWDLSPGYAPEDHQRFERPAAERCLTCHVGRYAPTRPGATSIAQRYEQPPLLEMGIGCERCHGPGGRHVQYHRDTPLVDKRPAEDPIVNPAALSASRRDSVCNQCHLQGDAQVLRYGRSHGDFRPGDHLGETWTIFIGGTGVDGRQETTAVSQVEQMHASRCYQATAGRLGCISCHDAHTVPTASNVAAHYRQRCLECHQQQGCSLPAEQQQAAPAVGSCIACHMPKLGAKDVPHTTQTDHRVLRRPGAGSLATRDEPPEERIFERDQSPLTELELARAQGLMLAERAEAAGDRRLAQRVARLLEPMRTVAPDDVEVLDSLALMKAMLGQVDDGIQLWNEALKIEPDQQEVLYSLLLIAAARRDAAQGRSVLERLLAANPYSSEWQARYAELLAALGEGSSALEAADRALQLHPGRVPVHQLRATLLQQRGDAAAASAARELAERLQQ